MAYGRLRLHIQRNIILDVGERQFVRVIGSVKSWVGFGASGRIVGLVMAQILPWALSLL